MPSDKVALKKHILTLLRERDRRYEARFQSTDALNVATATASKEAITKAEQAQAAHNTLSNNLRGQLEAQAQTLLPRAEADARLRGLAEKIDALAKEIQNLRESRSIGEGKGAGAVALWGYIIGGVGLLGGIIAIVIAVRP